MGNRNEKAAPAGTGNGSEYGQLGGEVYPKNIRDDDLVIATIPKNTREEIRVVLSEFKSYRRIGVRIWARTSEGAVPTRQGFAVSVERCPELIAALVAALEAAAVAWAAKE